MVCRWKMKEPRVEAATEKLQTSLSCFHVRLRTASLIHVNKYSFEFAQMKTTDVFHTAYEKTFQYFYFSLFEHGNDDTTSSLILYFSCQISQVCYVCLGLLRPKFNRVYGVQT